jgi:hypothetical protein
MAIAEQYEKGQLTLAQANEAIATSKSEIIAEEQRRGLANRSVAAQEGMADAAIFTATRPPTPVNCSTIHSGNMSNTSCF